MFQHIMIHIYKGVSMEKKDDKLNLISRNSLNKFYNMVRTDYMRDKKALSNKVIEYLINVSEAVWEEMLNKLEPVDLEMHRYDKMEKNLTARTFKIWHEKNRIPAEYLGYLFFAQSYFNGGSAQEQYKVANQMGLYDSALSNEDNFIYDYAVKTEKVYYLLSLSDKELAYKGIAKIEKELSTYNDVMEYVERWETCMALNEKDNNNMDVIQRLITTDNAGFIFDSEMVLKILLRNDYNFFQPDLSFYEEMTNEGFKKRVEEDPKQTEYLALYQKQKLTEKVQGDITTPSPTKRL